MQSPQSDLTPWTLTLANLLKSLSNKGLYKKNFASVRPKRIVLKVVLYQGQKMLKAVGLEKSFSDTERRDIESYIDNRYRKH